MGDNPLLYLITPHVVTNIIGTYECKVDAKGRLMLPTALKKQLMAQLESGFVLKRSMFEKCLELYPMEEWNTQMGMVNKLNRFVRKMSSSSACSPQGLRSLSLMSMGRLLIPKDLVGFSSISKDIVLASAGTHIELWDKGSYENKLSNPETDIATLAEDVMGSLNTGADELP